MATGERPAKATLDMKNYTLSEVFGNQKIVSLPTNALEVCG